MSFKLKVLHAAFMATVSAQAILAAQTFEKPHPDPNPRIFAQKETP